MIFNATTLIHYKEKYAKRAFSSLLHLGVIKPPALPMVMITWKLVTTKSIKMKDTNLFIMINFILNCRKTSIQ